MGRFNETPARAVRRVLGCTLGALLALGALPPTALADADHAAVVRDLEGVAFAYAAGMPARRLEVNDRVAERTKVATGRDAAVTLVFTDETELALGEKTVVNIDRYSYRAAAARQGESSFATSILGGVVRAVTGLIAKARPRSVTFSTRVATIGVRGTHFTAEVQGTSATIILLAQAAAEQANAIEVSNEFGTVEIDQPGWGTEIPDASSPPSPPRRMDVSNNMNRLLRSVNTTRRVRIPRSPMR